MPSIADEPTVLLLTSRHKRQWCWTLIRQAAHHPVLTCAAAGPAALISLASSRWLLWTAWYHPAVFPAWLPGPALCTWRYLLACHCDLQRRSGLTTPPVGEALHKLADSLTSLHIKTGGKQRLETASLENKPGNFRKFQSRTKAASSLHSD